MFPRYEIRACRLETFAVNVTAAGKIDFVHSTESVDPASQAVVGATHEGQTVFDRAENGVGRVLPLRRAFSEPAVVRQVQQEIRVRPDVLSRLVRERIFETD